jgi:DNA mismatch repair protein MutL
MSVINLLSPHVADLIAAGEVVERPASVVKELLENAIDAGARNVTVELGGGGMQFIRVTDDGCGMAPEDAGIAFLRHATSKLRDARGLEQIATLGFRGEALAAIAAVSHIELTTRLRGAPDGTRMTLTAGDIDVMEPAGCPEGTTMLVRDLFYNTPARQKFMKSDRAEGSACVGAALRVALGRPEVSVRCVRDGAEVFFSPGDGQARSAVYSLLGRETAMNLLACRGENEGVTVDGFVSAPHAGRGNRALQFFFVNGRAFSSATMQAALEQAYRNNLLTGRFPACVLYLTLGFGSVDVNVHPTKREVRFSEEKKVFDTVYTAVRAALEETGGRSTAELPLAPARPVRNPDFFKNMTAAELRGNGGAVPAAKPQREAAPVQTRLDLPKPFPAGMLELQDGGARGYAASPPVPKPDIPRIPAEAPAAGTPSGKTPDVRVIGEALGTYILAETDEALLLIDKHACHERINFDRLLAGLGPQMSQTLLTPVTWSPGADVAELLERNARMLDTVGFSIERFGEDGVIVRAVPADSSGSEIAMLEEIAETLRGGRLEDPRELICRTIACKAAIKAGRRSDPQELAVLAEKVASGEIRYCPHGRPVCVRLTKTELDRQFKRIV